MHDGDMRPGQQGTGGTALPTPAASPHLDILEPAAGALNEAGGLLANSPAPGPQQTTSEQTAAQTLPTSASSQAWPGSGRVGGRRPLYFWCNVPMLAHAAKQPSKITRINN